jgi:hypothetical protein
MDQKQPPADEPVRDQAEEEETNTMEQAQDATEEHAMEHAQQVAAAERESERGYQ